MKKPYGRIGKEHCLAAYPPAQFMRKNHKQSIFMTKPRLDHFLKIQYT